MTIPFTPILIGRLIDAARGDRVHDVERLFWAWSVAITVFFSLSRFKLDHYIYPVPPGLSLIVAHTWWRLRTAASIRPHLGAVAAVATVALMFVGAGLYAFLKLDTLPVTLSGAMRLVPAALAGADAIQFRIDHATDERVVNALKAVREASGWETRPAPPDRRNSAARAWACRPSP